MPYPPPRALDPLRNSGSGFSSAPLLAVLLIAWTLAGPPALAQSNPPVTACGLPAQGAIVSTVSYTLTANCQLTGSIVATAAISVTINGGGHTISGGAFILLQGSGNSLNLNNVTIDGARQTRTETITANALSATNATFINSRGGPAIAALSSTRLENVLLAGNSSGHYALGGNGSAVHAGVNTSHVWNNVVMRRNFGNGGAISLQTGATLTTTGCLTLSGNIPYDVYDPNNNWTDSSTGPCSGTIGNGGQASVPSPALMACGLPAPGVLDQSATYQLRGDCQLSGSLTISEDVDIHIVGNGFTLRSSVAGQQFFTAATSVLRLENVAFAGVRIFHWGDLRADRFRLTDTTGGAFLNVGAMRFSNALFENNSTATSTGRSVLLAWGSYRNGFTSFTDSAFRNNSGGLAPLQNAGATIELNGCVAFENNSPADFFGAVTDNRDLACDDEIVDPVIPVVPPAPPTAPNPNNPSPKKPKSKHSSHNWHEHSTTCAIPLGAIGCIYWWHVGGELLLAVYRIDEQSVGHYALHVSQSEVEATDAGLVACSLDGRVAARVGMTEAVSALMAYSKLYQELRPYPGARDIVVSKGPTALEGKTHHVIFDHALDGRVMGTVDTYDGLPAAECVEIAPEAAGPPPTPAPVYAPPVQPQASQADGSIRHIVQPGDTLSAIAVAYRVYQLDIIMLNNLEDMGRWIYPGQELLIREAGG